MIFQAEPESFCRRQPGFHTVFDGISRIMLHDLLNNLAKTATTKAACDDLLRTALAAKRLNSPTLLRSIRFLL